MEGACPGRPPPAWSRGVNELRSTAWCRRPRSRWPVVPEPARTAPRPRAVTGAPLPGTARTPATASMGGAGQPGRLRWRRAQQTPEGVLGQTELADVDGVFGDRVELRGVAAKQTLVRQGVSDIVNQNLCGIWHQWPKPKAGEGANEAVKPIHTQSETRLVARHNSPPCSSAETRASHSGNGGRSRLSHHRRNSRILLRGLRNQDTNSTGFHPGGKQ